MERPTRIRKVSTKIAENEEIEAIQVQIVTKAVIEAFQPVIDALTTQAAQLSMALQEQRAEFTAQVAQLSTALQEQRAEFTAQIENLKAEITTMITMQPSPAQSSSYAAAAALPLGTPPPRTPPVSQPSNLASISMSRGSTVSETLYCTIDASRVKESMQKEIQPGAIREAIEKEIRAKEGNNWRCAAVMKDPRNTARIRVACRDEKEHQAVKDAAEKVKVEGVRVLRDQLFPVKVDGVNRFAVLDENNQVRLDITDKLGKENEVEIAKLAWLSKKENPKAYGSMVIYVTKGSDAKRLRQEQFFHVAGESGAGHRHSSDDKVLHNTIKLPGDSAIRCLIAEKPQVCGKGALEGHHHKDCINETVPKCVLFVEGLTNQIEELSGPISVLRIRRIFQMLQLNVGKREMVQLSRTE